ncbi:MAG TPA: hypothetical protein PL193_17505 [Xanthobacteraceae bacterium]|nr:hypothetical protein [Xanthobacteraceae bacterium]
MLLRTILFALAILAGLAAPHAALAQRGGEVTVTITPPPDIKAASQVYAASGEHKLHFHNTTSRDAKIISMELLFIEQSEHSKSCDLFFGNVIGAAVRKYELKEVFVPSAKTATATARMLPADSAGDYRAEPSERAPASRTIIIACYKFVFELDDAELEVTQLAGRWTFERKTGKLLTKNVNAKAELLPR